MNDKLARRIRFAEVMGIEEECIPNFDDDPAWRERLLICLVRTQKCFVTEIAVEIDSDEKLTWIVGIEKCRGEGVWYGTSDSYPQALLTAIDEVIVTKNWKDTRP